jgi:phosphoribosylformylglycinamidine synthase subunit PurQ / glutaminase
MTPRIGVVVFPGSNDDRDAAEAVHGLGGEPVLVWHGDSELPQLDGVILPGGFSYGDYLRAGAIARFSPAMGAVSEFADAGGLVLGICNGFQVLCEAGLLPGALRPNTSLAFVCRDVGLVVERADTAFTSGCEPGQRLTIPVKHGEGCYVPPPVVDGHVVLRYAPGDNPNGSVDDIAGVVNERGNVMGLMPHPEHAVDPLLGSTDGALILSSLVVEAERRREARKLRERVA